MSALARRMAELVPPDVMVRILEDSLNKKEIVKLCNACGIAYKGVRTKSVPKEDLIDDLVDAFYEDEEAAQRIVEALSKADRTWIRKVQDSSPDQVEELLSQAPEGEVGKVLFALAVDGRPEVTDLLLDWEDSSAAEILERMAAFMGEREELERRVGSLEREVESLRRERDELKGQLEVLQRERKALKELLAQREREISSLRRANKELEAERDQLKERLEEGQDLRTLSSQMHQLVREQRKLCHDVERLLVSKEEDQGPGPFLEALGKAVGGLRDTLVNLSEAWSKHEESLWRGLEAVRHEVQGLTAEVRGLKSTERRGRSAGGPPRVGVFVDVQNMFYSARQLGGRLDFEKLLEVTVAGRRLVRAIAYVVTAPDVDQSKFVTMLRQKGYEVKIKELRKRIDGSAKGDWDMGMAIDIVRLSESLDVVVLVSGDGDFVDLVNLVKTKGPRVEVFSFDQNTSKDLIEAADAYYPIGEELLRPMGV